MKTSFIGRLLAAFKEPIPAETRALLVERWGELPGELKTDWQALGRHLVHCGYVMGPAYCSFGCTHCYLPKGANRVPLPSLDEMKAQIDANRRLIGPGGRLQITGGDVVDAYWRAGRADELISIVRHANDVGVVPMLMTHGQVLLEHPEYLARLVSEGGLRKVGLHIDITQAGRPGYPLRGLRSEVDLHPLRKAFVELILRIRRQTRVALSAAHTVTVTERNLDSIADILRWLIHDPRHLDVFHTVSFQTETDVGRTRFSDHPVSPTDVWQAICAGIKLELPRDNLWFGHPDCNSVATLLVLFPARRVINLIPSDVRSRVFWSSLLQHFGGVSARGEYAFESTVRELSILLRHPSFLLKLVRYSWWRLQREGLGASGLMSVLSGQARGINVVLHNFMSARDLAEPRSETVNKRLAACAFRGVVRRGEHWIAVPMCTMNAHHRPHIYAEQIAASSRKSNHAARNMA
ncbi:MAG: hypothetical protein ACE5NW_03935 [Acidiferrobacterales bacterium]